MSLIILMMYFLHGLQQANADYTWACMRAMRNVPPADMVDLMWPAFLRRLFTKSENVLPMYLHNKLIMLAISEISDVLVKENVIVQELESQTVFQIILVLELKTQTI